MCLALLVYTGIGITFRGGIDLLIFLDSPESATSCLWCHARQRFLESRREHDCDDRVGGICQARSRRGLVLLISTEG